MTNTTIFRSAQHSSRRSLVVPRERPLHEWFDKKVKTLELSEFISELESVQSVLDEKWASLVATSQKIDLQAFYAKSGDGEATKRARAQGPLETLKLANLSQMAEHITSFLSSKFEGVVNLARQESARYIKRLCHCRRA